MTLQPNDAMEKCKGVGCEYKNQCLRHKRPSAPNQKWQPFDKHANGDCVHYLSIPKS